MIRAVLVGDKKLEQWLAGRFPEIYSGLGQSMARLVIKLTRKIKEEKLSGQVLKNRTGTLRRSISPEVQMNSPEITGTVGTNVVYASIHEFGFQGTETVKAHLRRAKEQRAVLKSGKLSRKNWAVPKSGGMIQVKSFTRTVNMPERSFMRTALKEMSPEIRAEFNNALTRVVRVR